MLAIGSLAFGIGQSTTIAQSSPPPLATQPPAPSPAKEATPQTSRPVVEQLTREAAQLKPLIKSALAIEFLDMVPLLSEPQSRTLYRNREKGIALTPAQWNWLSEEDKNAAKPQVFPPEFFYNTGYGSPLIYVRTLDLAGKHGLATLDQRHVMDFGSGTIGHLRVMALQGATARGVDVDPVLAALYSAPEDQGAIGAGKNGSAWQHIGRWPAEPDIVRTVGTGFDLITSKNTLKEGYIHPKPPEGKTANPKQLITLGVDDAAFLRHIHDSLNPGGLFIIYNICPAQSDPKDLTKPYIPFADGKSPFSRAQFATAGLDVLEFDVVDSAWAIDAFTALGYNDGASKDAMSKTIFCWYTIAKRPSTLTAPDSPHTPDKK